MDNILDPCPFDQTFHGKAFEALGPPQSNFSVSAWGRQKAQMFGGTGMELLSTVLGIAPE